MCVCVCVRIWLWYVIALERAAEYSCYIDGLASFINFHDIEVDVFAFLEGAEVAVDRVDTGVMNKHVLTNAFTRGCAIVPNDIDKTVPVVLVEPFNFPYIFTPFVSVGDFFYFWHIRHFLYYLI